MIGSSERYCKNCEYELNGSFCENCGQRASIGKITFKETFQDFINAVFSVDAPLILTLKMLVVNPGKLFREYLSGKRKAYYKPVPFFILTTIVYVVVRVLLNFDPTEGMIMAGGSEKVNDLVFKNAGVYMSENMNNFLFVFVFTFGFIIKVFFFKKYKFAEYIAISFYAIGIYILILTLSIVGLKYASPIYRSIPFLLMLIYIVFALISFFQNKNILTIVKIFLAYFFAIIFYTIISFGISLLIIWMKTN